MPALAFCAGLLGSSGPCLAPRALATISLAAAPAGRGRALRIAAFSAGIVGWYVIFGTAGAWALRVSGNAPAIDAALGAILCALGVRGLLQPTHANCMGTRQSLGGAFLFGGALGVVGAPCCTPVVLAIAAVAGAANDPTYGAIAVGAFALGHVVPLAVVGRVAQPVARYLAGHNLQSAVAVVSGALMVALGLLFAAIA